MRPTELSARANRIELAAPSDWTELLAAEADAAAPRILTIQATGTIAVKVVWSAGKGFHTVSFSLARGTRLAVWARTLRVEVGNLSTSASVHVSVTVADGWETHRNQLMVPFGSDQAAQDATIPDFARTVRLELADPAQLGSAYVDLFDAGGTLRSRTLGNAQPAQGIALAGAASMQVLAPSDGRLIFDLCL